MWRADPRAPRDDPGSGAPTIARASMRASDGRALIGPLRLGATAGRSSFGAPPAGARGRVTRRRARGAFQSPYRQVSEGALFVDSAASAPIRSSSRVRAGKALSGGG